MKVKHILIVWSLPALILMIEAWLQNVLAFSFNMPYFISLIGHLVVPIVIGGCIAYLSYIILKMPRDAKILLPLNFWILILLAMRISSMLGLSVIIMIWPSMTLHLYLLGYFFIMQVIIRHQRRTQKTGDAQ